MKRARRRPYISLIPRRPRSCYLLWNLGQALASSTSTIEIQVGYFDEANQNRFVLLKTIGPPKVSGGTFLHFDEEYEDQLIVAMVIQKSFLPASPHRVTPGDVYAISHPIRMLRSHPLNEAVRFVAVTYQYPLPLKIEPLSPEMIDVLKKFKLSPDLLRSLLSSSAGSSASSANYYL